MALNFYPSTYLNLSLIILICEFSSMTKLSEHNSLKNHFLISFYFNLYLPFSNTVADISEFSHLFRLKISTEICTLTQKFRTWKMILTAVTLRCTDCFSRKQKTSNVAKTKINTARTIFFSSKVCHHPLLPGTKYLLHKWQWN